MNSREQLKVLYNQYQNLLLGNLSNDIPDILIEIDKLLRDILDGKVSKNPQKKRKQEEKVFLESLEVKTSIDTLLMQLSLKVRGILKKSAEQINHELDIYVIRIAKTILPPGELDIKSGDGDSDPREKPELLESRYARIIEILMYYQVFPNDLIVYQGRNTEDMLRQTGYYVIQIPKLLKTIFVCNEYGEASFIVHSIVPPEVFTDYSKADLRQKLGAERITHTINWQEKFRKKLFRDQDELKEVQTAKKVDVREWQMYIDEIKRLYPTPESFMEIGYLEKKDFKLFGNGLLAIGSIILGKNIFNNSNSDFNPIGSSIDQARLAIVIYGEGIEIIEHKFWGKNEWRDKIKELYPTPENFMELKHQQKKDFKLFGNGLLAIGSIILGKNIFNDTNGKFNPVAYKRDYSYLARAIYGEEIEVIECEFWEKERWIEEIKKLYPTSKKFIGLMLNFRGLFTN